MSLAGLFEFQEYRTGQADPRTCRQHSLCAVRLFHTVAFVHAPRHVTSVQSRAECAEVDQEELPGRIARMRACSRDTSSDVETRISTGNAFPPRPIVVSSRTMSLV